MPLKGFLEAVEPFQVRGWVCDTACPDKPLTVEILLRDQAVGTTLANLYRLDLEKGGVGTGEHAFIFNFAKKLSDDDLKNVSARAGRADGPFEPLPVLPESSQAPAQPTFQRTQLEFLGPRVDERQEPIFVLGAARSGTTAVAQALLRLFPGHMEGHLIDLLAHLAVATVRFYAQKTDERASSKDTMVSAISKDYVQNSLDAMFIEIIRRMFSEGRWVEKTPNSDMIYLAPRLKQMWPKSRFIFMKRRFLENLQSRLRKFPMYDFEKNASEWTQAMAAWMDVRSHLAGSAIEIDQDYLSRKPAEVAVALRDFLQLTEAEAARLGQALKNNRPERTSDLADTYIDLESLRWTQPQIDEFKRTCLRWMDVFGYSTDATYFKPGFEGQKLVIV
jgi:Sulfotransferase family